MSSIFEKRNPKLDLGSTPRKEGSTFEKWNPKLDSLRKEGSTFEKWNPKLDLGSTPRKEGSTFEKRNPKLDLGSTHWMSSIKKAVFWVEQKFRLTEWILN